MANKQTKQVKQVKQDIITTVLTAEQLAINAVLAISDTYAGASKAICSYACVAKENQINPDAFNSGLIRIGNAAPGVAKITVGAYLSNARRIFAASMDEYNKAVETAGTDSIKALSEACPAVRKAKAKKAKAENEPVHIVATPEPGTKAANSGATLLDQVVSEASNNLLAMRRLADGKRKAKLILAAIGEMEDMLQDVVELLKAA